MKHNFYGKNVIYAENKNTCVGCGHFVATYRRMLIENEQKTQVDLGFKNGLEEDFFDAPIDKAGYYRLSTIKSFAYHVGNNLANIHIPSNTTGSSQIDACKLQSRYDNKKMISKIPYRWRMFFISFLRKTNLL